MILKFLKYIIFLIANIVIINSCSKNKFPQELILEGFSSNLNSGIIREVKTDKETLIIKFDNNENQGEIKISPWYPKNINYLLNSKISIINHDFPDGPSYLIEFKKNEEIVLLIGINIMEKFKILDKYEILRDNNIVEKNSQRDWVNVIIKSKDELISIKSGEITKINDIWKILLYSATVPNDKIKNSEISDESPDFRADFIIFK